jgi:hypothetical protein
MIIYLLHNIWLWLITLIFIILILLLTLFCINLNKILYDLDNNMHH